MKKGNTLASSVNNTVNTIWLRAIHFLLYGHHKQDQFILNNVYRSMTNLSNSIVNRYKKRSVKYVLFWEDRFDRN